MGKNLLDLFLMETRSNSVKEVGLKIVNESYLLVISFVLFIETIVSPPRPAQSQRLVKEREIILFLKPIQGYGSSKMVFLMIESANKAEINVLSARDTTRPGP